MGTNYYWHKDGTERHCETCSCHLDDELHIGKSSAGWVFALRIHPEIGIHDLSDWRVYWREHQGRILDEYGAELSIKEMLRKITERSFRREDGMRPFGYDSWDEFHRKNHSQHGPNGCVRARIDGVRVVAHGPGTWDLHIGEFS